MTTTTSAQTAGSASVKALIPARVDRLPWTSFQTKLVVPLGVAWLLDGIEITIASAIAAVLNDQATRQTVAWCVIFFFPSAGASAAYLTVRASSRSRFARRPSPCSSPSRSASAPSARWCTGT